jgi:hypothetical protein
LPKVQPRAGEVVEQVTQTRIIPPDEQSSDSDPKDIFEYMAGLTPEECNSHLAYVYRISPPNAGGYIDKVVPPFDEAYVKDHFGGGEYNIFLKRGSERKRIGKLKIVGDPKAANSNGATLNVGAAQSDVIQAMNLLLEKLGKGENTPQAASMDLMKAAFMNAMEIQKTAVQTQQMGPIQILELAKTLSAQNSHASEMPEWAKQMISAAIPLVMGLIGKVLQPGDPVEQIKTMASAMSTIKELGGGGTPVKLDFATELLRGGPGWLAEGAKFLAEMRAANTLRMQAEMVHQNRNPAVVIPSVNAAPVHPAAPAPPIAQQQPPTPAAVPIESQISDGAPTPQWVMTKVAEMIERGDGPAFVLDFVDEHMPEIIGALKTMSLEVLRATIVSDPFLGRLAKLPNFDQYIIDLHKELHNKDSDLKPN